MNRKIKERILPGSICQEVRAYETAHRKIARKAAAEGMVLLKNEHTLLPLPKGKKIALYGAGAVVTIKGGTGSGDVNAREIINIYEGLKGAGYEITTKDSLIRYQKRYEEARLSWRQVIWDKEDAGPKGKRLSLFYAYSSTPFRAPVDELPIKTDTDTAVYVLSRIAGEGRDRRNEEGDYLLSKEEETAISEICRLYPHVVLALNTGGIVDLSILDRYPQIQAVLYVHQPGMEGGNAFADLISGAITPSGKLTDTWAYDYMDYPEADSFSHMDGNVDREEYREGIYVGYRYFDTYDIPVRYGFGYGLSYTCFEINSVSLQRSRNKGAHTDIIVEAKVTNIGFYSGKEVVQVYLCPPQKRLDKEYRKLAAFVKTKNLMPGESETVKAVFSADALSYYDEKESAWIIEQGVYGVFTGNSLENSRLSGSIQINGDLIVAQTEHVCPTDTEIREWKGNPEKSEEKRRAWMEAGMDKPLVELDDTDLEREIYRYTPSYADMPKEVLDFVETLSMEQMILLATGNIYRGQGSALGSSGISVPGSAAETSDCAQVLGLAPIVLADGPAGLRLSQTYYIENGNILPLPMGAGLENGFLCRNAEKANGEAHYQYCTAFPTGTLLAQSWDVKLLKEVGRTIAEELKEFGVTLWLAPGMNIHRNPLCGRNFEYYSEDPLVSGLMAAAVTEGVQSLKGYGTTIKHFACNNQEDNRMNTDSIMSERTLREIYLKGFEIAVKKSHPMSMMTSYNLVNGVHAANNYDLCTKIARNEWHYQGYIITDWTTTMQDDSCTAAGCIRAGNDGIMPGCGGDHENIRRELERGYLDIRDLKRSVARLVYLVWQSDVYE